MTVSRDGPPVQYERISLSRLPESNDWGYLKGFDKKYKVLKKLGQGGNGVVNVVEDQASGLQYACKKLCKVLNEPKASDVKKATHCEYLRREIDVLLTLRGTLNVACLHEVYEDEDHVYMVMDYCRGGELLQRVREGQHTERSVASYIRDVLLTLIQCHECGIIHRDIKAENFMFFTKDPQSPLKAIDFGLAVFYDKDRLPMLGLNLEGTPWYLAPEVCRGKVFPASDVWAVGILTTYLLTGMYPFIDKISPNMPAMTRTLRAIIADPLDLSGKQWKSISEEAKDFVAFLLNKDPLRRPTAKQAYHHAWLKVEGDGTQERGQGKKLSETVVQRIQRFGQSSLFKRTVLEHVAAEMLAMQAEPSETLPSRRGTRGGSEGGSREGSRPVSPNGAALQGSNRAAFESQNEDRNENSGGWEASTRGYAAYVDMTVRGGHEFFRSSGPQMSKRPLGYNPDLDLTVHNGSRGGGDTLATPFSERLDRLYQVLCSGVKGDREALLRRMQKLGYDLSRDELDQLIDQVDVDRDGSIHKAELVAAMLDWNALQELHKEKWLESAHAVFREIDRDGDGLIGADEIMAFLGKNLSDYEMEAALQQALKDAHEQHGGLEGISFETFQEVLGKEESDLADFDPRLRKAPSQESAGGRLPAAGGRLSTTSKASQGCGCTLS